MHHRSIELQLGDESEVVNADQLQIEQVLLNLAINARDAMPEGKGNLIIATRPVTLDMEYCRLHPGVQPGRYVNLSVSDSGCGMSRETVERIFEPFFTTKGAGKGTGLGLSIVFGIVKQHGGHIACHSIVGQGTTFNMYFPIVESAIGEDSGPGDAVTVGGSEQILLVDDEAPVLQTSSEILKQAGYTVFTASRAREAIELYRIRRNDIALIILDLMMPEMGGNECLRELLKTNPRARIIISSGVLSESDEEEAINWGAKAFLKKPYSTNKLLGVVRKVLDAD